MNGFRVHFHAWERVFISIDGCFYGEGNGLILRLAEGEHCLRIEGADAQPMVKLLTVETSVVRLSGARVHCWPDRIAEVFLPRPLRPSPRPRQRVNLGEGLRGLLYEGVLGAEDNLGVRWTYPIPLLEEVELYPSGESLILKGKAGDEAYALILDARSGDCLREEWAEEVLLSRSGERVALIERIGDLPLVRQRVIDSRGEVLSCEWAEQKCESGVKRFLSALIAGRESEGMALLSDSLRRECDFAELKDFFGEIDTVREPIFYPCSPVTLMLGRRQGDTTFLTPYHFTLTGEGKIDNFCEL